MAFLLVLGACTGGASPRADVVFSDPGAWRVVRTESTVTLELAGGTAYTPPFRSPHSIALFPDVYGDFVLEFEARQTGPEYAHRDLCVFFAFESPSRFAYVHLASKPDPNAHNVFVVDAAPRRNLLPPQERGIDWGVDVWHRVRVERTLSDGSVQVYFDEGETPLFEVAVPLGVGRVGVGSFDDSGCFRAIRLTGDVVTEDASDPFRLEGSRGEEVPRVKDPAGMRSLAR